MRLSWALATAALLLGLSPLATGVASAQRLGPRPPPTYGPGSRPNLSPYLNLLRGGDQAANYFLGTRPEIQRRENAQYFNSQINALDARTSDLDSRERQLEDRTRPQEVENTGTSVSFGGTGGFFNNTRQFYGRPNTGRGR